MDLEVVYPAFRHLQRYTPALAADLGYGPGFHVIPRRWVVDRTFSWISKQYRMSKDDERLTESTEALISLVGNRLLLARLARA
jgi:putative transposase